MDLTSIAFATMLALGLIASDAFVNANTLYIDASVAGKIEEEGYSDKVVVGRFITEVKRITDSKSLISSPKFKSEQKKSFAMALAEAGGLENAMIAIQDLIGFVPPRLNATFVVDGDTPIFEMSGYSNDYGWFELEIEQKGRTHEVIEQAAMQTVLKLDPYMGILHQFEEHSEDGDFSGVKKLIDDYIAVLPPTPINMQRAHVENLRGIIGLLENNMADAETYFKRAMASKASFAVAHMNLCFTLVHEGRYKEAIAIANLIVEPWHWPMTSNRVLLASSHVVKGVAHWGLGQIGEAETHFKHATRINRRTSEGHVYWARLWESEGKKAEAREMYTKALANTRYFENYPEVASLYFWLNEKADQPLKRRKSALDIGSSHMDLKDKGEKKNSG